MSSVNKQETENNEENEKNVEGIDGPLNATESERGCKCCFHFKPFRSIQIRAQNYLIK